MADGYSGTPLAKKLGIKPGFRVALIDEPSGFRSLLDGLPEGVAFEAGIGSTPDLIIAFHTARAELERNLGPLADAVFPDRAIWLAWPKKTSKVPTDLTGDIVRATVLATELVDIKVCAISEVWSGLKVVWRKEHRSTPGRARREP